MNGEEVIEYCSTDYWIWVVTNRRLLKYRPETGGGERLHDISFDEISSVSVVRTGRTDELAGYGVFSILAGIVIDVLAREVATTVVLVPLGVYLLYIWKKSDEAYFQFQGGGLLATQGNDWRIDETSADDPVAAREFVKAVRSQL